MSGPDAARLAAVAAWEPGRLAAGVLVLDVVAGRLPGWRFRLEAVGRDLQSADVWSGTAAAAAAAMVLRLSDAVTAVTRGLEASLESCRSLVREAEAAAELAVEARALVLADARVDVAPGAAVEVPGTADDALWHADRAASAATAAGAALSGLGVCDAFVDGDFEALAGRARTDGPPPVPVGAAPESVAAWWVALPASAQQALVRSHPGSVGALDGVPAWARDSANRLLLARALAAAEPSATARAVDAELRRRRRDGEPVQLYAFDERGERVAFAVGDLDAAEAVAVLVPGVGTTPGDDLHRVTANVDRVVTQAAAGAPGLTVAGLAWLGYRPPRGPAIALRARARQAGPVLDHTLAGLAESRSAVLRRAARTTVMAHSYGTLVVDEAADAPGRLAADAVVLLGSPGMEPTGAPGLEAPEVYAAASAGDPVSWLGWFGPSPTAPRFGALELPGEPDMGHSDYFDADRPTLAALGEVVTGPPSGRSDGPGR